MSDNIINQIIEDHQNIITYYTNYKSANSTEDKNKWFNQFVWLVSCHSVAEELVLYPLIESKGETGKLLADQARKDHHKVKENLYDVSNETDDTAFDQKMDVIMSDLREHIDQEEKENLPFLSEHVSQEDLISYGKSFAFRKKIVPTRPHPSIPERPTALEMGLGILLTPLDKFADLFRGFPQQE